MKIKLVIEQDGKNNLVYEFDSFVDLCSFADLRRDGVKVKVEVPVKKEVSVKIPIKKIAPKSRLKSIIDKVIK